ncbi:MFS transporter [Pseudomonas chlororaphis]|uniref:Sugar transporter n=1 Tax=Pseudomonas chlororaphis TaxID=587753 RepID=A0A1Q8EP20_9PSED|nr:glycoside-pentoside-hexuronide (GPH):cation symporter [Pseudomonas chlororaphis]OLF53547.1 sugar transporter [Pseudomonas chlororaphis]
MVHITPIKAQRKMSLGRKISLGAGDFGVNLYWQIASLFLLFFYTEVLGLSASAAGLVYMSALIWDAAVDPLIGAMADRTRTRFGRFRPYLILGAVPLAIAFVLVFALPRGPATQLLALTIVSHFAFRTLFALVSVPYASLYARVTQDSEERATMAGIRMVFAILAAMVVSATTLPATRYFGGDSHAWALVTALFAAVASIALWTAALAAGNDDAPDAVGEPAQDRPGLGALLASLASNRPLLLVLGITLMNSCASTFFSKNLLYYFKYVRNDPDFGGTALALMAALAALSAPAWAHVARTRGKRPALLAGTACYCLGFIFWYLFNACGYAVLLAILALIAIGASATAVCFWAMVPDTVEYGQWRSGLRTESLIIGTVIFVQKAALGIAAGTLGLALGAIGFVPNSPQSAQTTHLLLATMSWVPLSGSIGVFLIGCAYPIGPALHRRLLAVLARRERRTRTAPRALPPASQENCAAFARP